MVPLFNVSLIEYKTLRSEPSIRLTFDIGERSPMTVAALHKFRTAGTSNLIICDDQAFAAIMDLTGNKEALPAELKTRLAILEQEEEEQERDADVHTTE